MEKQQAYEMVLDDIIKNGPHMFLGVFDAKNGNPAFMYGIQTVIEHIAINVSDSCYEHITDMLTSNMVKSRERAER